MKYDIVEITELSGEECHIYSIRPEGNECSLFDNFLLDNFDEYEKEIKDIYNRLRVIGKETGAREQFFKKNEGKPGDGVCALFDKPGSKLRLYCITYGHTTLLLGDGGPKPKNFRAWQEVDGLNEKVPFLMRISNLMTEKIREKDIKITLDGRLTGDLTLTDTVDSYDD